MYTPLEAPDSSRGPFHPHRDPGLFFPGGQREEICRSLILDLQAGKSLLQLGGDAGCGKTLLCQVIMERLPAEWVPVYLNDPSGSYEELLHYACLELGPFPGDKPDTFSWPGAFNALLHQRQAAGERVLLILDQAERMFSATLERLLYRNQQADDEQVPLAILLSGTGGLQNLLEQLEPLDPGNIPEVRYILPPLDRGECDRYLRHRLEAAGVPREEHDSLLPEKQRERIFKKAQGNIARTNALAAEFLARRPAGSAARPEANLPDREAPGEAPPQRAAQESAADRASAAVSGQREQGISVLIALYELLLGNRGLLTGLLAAGIFLLGLGLYLDAAPPPAVPGQEMSRVTAVTESGQSGSGEEADSPPDAGTPEGQGPAEQALQSRGQRGETGEGLPPQPDARRLLRERLAASTSLVAAAYRGGSTIQLVSASGQDAEERILQLLATPAFLHASHQLYIVKRRAKEPVYFIFYGIFGTLEQARQARNNLPFELRTHHPYPLAITDALLLNEG